MAELTKRSSKEELYDAYRKWQKRFTDAERKRQGFEEQVLELTTRVEGLTTQVALYKENDKENQKTLHEKTNDLELAEARLLSLEEKVREDEGDLKAIQARLSQAESENAMLLQAAQASLTTLPTDIVSSEDLDSSSVTQLKELVLKREQQLQEALAANDESQTRIKNLMTSHEAFIEQSRLETEKEITARVDSAVAELKFEKARWQQDRQALIDTHMRQQDELQQQYDELREGVEKSQVWFAKDKEAQRLREELESVSEDYNALSEKLAELASLKAELAVKDESIASLRDQLLEAEADISDTRALCIQALKQSGRYGAPAAPGNDSFPGATATPAGKSVSSAASSASISPPTSPKDRPADLFEFAASNRAKSKREQQMQQQLQKFKSKIKAEELARQRSMDEVESYRADYVNSLLTELETLRKAAAEKADGTVPSTELVRLRGSFQRERETWEMEKQDLEKHAAQMAEQLAEARKGGTEEAVSIKREGVDADKFHAALQAESAKLELQALASQRELEAVRTEHKKKEANLLNEMEELKSQIQVSESRGQELSDRCSTMEAQVAVSLKSAQKLRDAEDRIMQLSSEVETLRTAAVAARGGSDNGSLSSLPTFLRSSPTPADDMSDGQRTLSPPLAPSSVTRAQLEADRRQRIEALVQQFRDAKPET